MDYFGSNLPYWLMWLLTAACGVLAIVKFRGTTSALLAGLGFGVFISIPLLMQFFGLFDVYWYEYRMLFDLFRMGGWVLLLIAFIKLPAFSGSQATSYGGGAPGGMYNQPPAGAGAYPTGQTQAWAGPGHYGGVPGRMQFIPKGLYIGSILGGAGASILFGLLALMLIADNEEEAGLPFLIIGIMVMIYAAVMIAMLVHKLWEAIQPAHPRTTPGQAVGYMFIPFYNFYWMFQVYHGWAQDYNRYIRSAQLAAPPVSESIGLTVSILAVCSAVPYIGVLPALANLVCMGLFFSQAIDGANSLIAIHSQQAGAAQGPHGA